MRFYGVGVTPPEQVFEDGAQYPAARPVEMMQIMDRSAGGTTHVETYATPISQRILVFDNMSENDYSGLYDWWINQANGMANEFYFEDERGAVFFVRFNTPKFGLAEKSYQRYAGRLSLEILA